MPAVVVNTLGYTQAISVAWVHLVPELAAMVVISQAKAAIHLVAAELAAGILRSAFQAAKGETAK